MSATAGVRGWGAAAAIAARAVGVVLAILVVVQALIVVEARPQDLITGFHGMVDIIRRATPPDFSRLPDVAWPALETVDIAIFGTLGGVIMALLRGLAHEHGQAVMCVLHQVDLAFDFADRVVGMYDGRIAFDRRRADLSRDAVQRLYLPKAA